MHCVEDIVERFFKVHAVQINNHIAKKAGIKDEDKSSNLFIIRVRARSKETTYNILRMFKVYPHSHIPKEMKEIIELIIKHSINKILKELPENKGGQ